MTPHKRTNNIRTVKISSGLSKGLVCGYWFVAWNEAVRLRSRRCPGVRWQLQGDAAFRTQSLRCGASEKRCRPLVATALQNIPLPYYPLPCRDLEKHPENTSRKPRGFTRRNAVVPIEIRAFDQARIPWPQKSQYHPKTKQPRLKTSAGTTGFLPGRCVPS